MHASPFSMGPTAEQHEQVDVLHLLLNIVWNALRVISSLNKATLPREQGMVS